MAEATATRRRANAALDLDAIRAEFPVLRREVHGRRLVYLDTAASAQRPQAVIDAVSDFYARYNANVHRGVHALSQEATDAFEAARRALAEHVGAASDREIVFTRGTTEAINLVAQGWLRPRVGPGDRIVVTHMEHHSNIVPWQLVAEQTGAELVVAPVSDAGELELDALEALLDERVKLLGVVHVSNALGTVNPVKAICRMAGRHGIPVLVDGAQAMAHEAVDVRDLGCTFYALSGHKMYGPTGIGALWAPYAVLDAMAPWQGGGEMIDVVDFEGTTFAAPPARFEAGTPNIAGAIGLGAAVAWLRGVGLARVAAHEASVLDYATRRIAEIDGVHVVGTAAHKAGVLSFVMDGAHPNDIGTLIDHFGVAIRTGHHCTMPLIKRLGHPATARASFGVYSGEDDVDAFIEALGRARDMLC